MQLRVMKPVADNNGQYKMTEVPVEDIDISNYAIMAIDGSTRNSGIAIIRQFDGGLLYSISASRDTSGDETPVQYKVRLKRAVKEILLKNRMIAEVYYEEPIIANISSVSNLFMLRTFVEELIVENEPTFDYLKHFEISNMRWKKEFLVPDKVPQGTENQKKAVREKLERALPFLNVVSQDEIDAICMGCVVVKTEKAGASGEELQSKKKARAFKYKVEFFGADSDEDLFADFWSLYGGPKSILENGVYLFDLGPRSDFDKTIYERMGSDDKLLVLKFASGKHGNVVLKHKIGGLAAQYKYIYAVVWRENRR